MRAAVDTTLCNGCGMCPIVCPEVFRMVAHPTRAFAVVHSKTVPDAATECFDIARNCCKRGAIRTIAGLLAEPGTSRKAQATCH
jgi:ferredoxin